MALTNKQREDIEVFLCEFYDALDKTKTNSEFMQVKWSKMSNAQFENWLKRDYPLQLQVRAWEIEPTFKDYQDAAKVIGIPLLEKVALPYLYVNKEGVPVNSKEALVMRLHFKKVQQFITKKNKISIDIDDRDMKGGRLNSNDKGAATSDKEMECFAIMGMENAMEEFATIKADCMNSKSEAYNHIATTGTLSKDDYHPTIDESLSRNLISYYLLACHIDTNLVNKDGYTPYTLKEKSRRTQREV